MSPVATAIPEPSIPVADAVQSRFEVAAQILDRALGSAQGPQRRVHARHGPQAPGQDAEARTALRKIAKPDANVLLQMGLLSLQRREPRPGRGRVRPRLGDGPDFYETCYNLLLTQLTLGKVEACLDLIPQGARTASPAFRRDEPSPAAPADEQRFLQVLQALLRCCEKGERPRPMPAESPAPTSSGCSRWSAASASSTRSTRCSRRWPRPGRSSAAVRDAYVEAVLVKAKELIDRCDWTEAELLLRPMAARRQRQPAPRRSPCSTCSAAAPA